MPNASWNENPRLLFFAHIHTHAHVVHSLTRDWIPFPCFFRVVRRSRDRKTYTCHTIGRIWQQWTDEIGGNEGGQWKASAHTRDTKLPFKSYSWVSLTGCGEDASRIDDAITKFRFLFLDPAVGRDAIGIVSGNGFVTENAICLFSLVLLIVFRFFGPAAAFTMLICGQRCVVLRSRKLFKREREQK